MKLLPLLGKPTVWRFGELASLKLAMLSLGFIVAHGISDQFWALNYWVVWLVFVLAMIIPASKWFGVMAGTSAKQSVSRKK